MNNEQLIYALEQIHDLIHHETTPRFTDGGEEVSDGEILDRIFALVKPIVQPRGQIKNQKLTR